MGNSILAFTSPARRSRLVATVAPRWPEQPRRPAIPNSDGSRMRDWRELSF
jgi:hypothetical protein